MKVLEAYREKRTKTGESTGFIYVKLELSQDEAESLLMLLKPRPKNYAFLVFHEAGDMPMIKPFDNIGLNEALEFTQYGEKYILEPVSFKEIPTEVLIEMLVKQMETAFSV